MKYVVIFALELLIPGLAAGQRPLELVRTYGGRGVEAAHALADTGTGLVWAGSFTDSLALDSIRFGSTGATDAVIANVGYDGAVQWARRLGGIGADAWKAVGAVAPSLAGQATALVAGGTFTDRLDYGGVNPLRAQGNNADIVLAQFSPDGALGWIRTVGGAAGDDYLNSLAVRADGSFCAAGSFDTRATFFDREVVAQGGHDAWVACFEANGALQWVQTGGGTGADRWNGLVLTHNAVYVSGSFRDNAAFGERTLVARGGADAMFARYSASGELEWIRQAGGLSDDEAVGAGQYTSSRSAELYATWLYFTGTFGARGAIFESTVLPSEGGRDVFVASYTEGGSPRWARGFGSANDDAPAPAVVGTPGGLNGGPYLTGHTGTAAFDATTVFARDSSDAIGLLIDARSGRVQDVFTAGGPQPDAGTAAALRFQGRTSEYYTMGTFGAGARFGATVVPAPVGGSTDLFLSRFSLALTLAADAAAGTGEGLGAPQPQPARGAVVLPVQVSAPASLRIFDTLGREVHRAEVARDDAEVRVRVETWAPGVYVARLQTRQGVHARTFVVAR